LVPWDLCDHSQTSQVVRNDVRSNILLTTVHVITDWPISDHMIWTSHRRSHTAICVQGGTHRLKMRAPFMNDNPLLHCSCPAVYVHGPDGKWLITALG
ncbi:unnamed protein product, partial [Staurois parvus]